MSGLALDHLIVATASLDQGAAWCEATLGVAPAAGGRHALFGTHNRLLSISSETFGSAYLEIIAIDPDAPPPARSRWFGLDDPGLQASLRASPRLIHAVVRTTAIDSHRHQLIDLGHDPGEIVRASRGRLSWQIVVRHDGALEAGGALPTLIQWDGPHPAEAMPASGLLLQGLALRGLSPRVRDLLAMPGLVMLDGPGPALRATLSTPRGAVTLESR
jgi:Glyoxalase-like domain